MAGLAGACKSEGMTEVMKSIRLEMIHSKASLESRLLLARKAGFDAVELNSQGYGRVEMLNALTKTGMKVISVYHSENWTGSISSTDENKRQSAVDAVLKTVETAEMYDADFIQLLAGKDIEQPGEDGKKSLLRSLRQINASLNGNVRLLLQNFSGKNMSSPAFMESILSQFNSNSPGLCLDTEMATVNGGLKQWYSLLKKYVSKVDLDESSFGGVSSLIFHAQGLRCISLDASGGAESRILRLGNLACIN